MEVEQTNLHQFSSSAPQRGLRSAGFVLLSRPRASVRIFMRTTTLIMLLVVQSLPTCPRQIGGNMLFWPRCVSSVLIAIGSTTEQSILTVFLCRDQLATPAKNTPAKIIILSAHVMWTEMLPGWKWTRRIGRIKANISPVQ